MLFRPNAGDCDCESQRNSGRGRGRVVLFGKELMGLGSEVKGKHCAGFTFTFMHLADAFIQSDLHCIQAIHFLHQYVCSLGIEPTTFYTTNAMIYH